MGCKHPLPGMKIGRETCPDCGMVAIEGIES
jgi:hypothetical protein